MVEDLQRKLIETIRSLVSNGFIAGEMKARNGVVGDTITEIILNDDGLKRRVIVTINEYKDN